MQINYPIIDHEISPRDRFFKSTYWKMNLFANAFYYELGDRHKGYKATAQQVVRLSRNNSLNLALSWMRDFDLEQNEIKLNWNIYF